MNHDKFRPITLQNLKARFMKRETAKTRIEVDGIKGADGVCFVCPHCLAKNGGVRPGVHSVLCWEPHVPQDTPPVPGRWNLIGTGIDDLTLQHKSSSISLSGCGAHFFVILGSAYDCGTPMPKMPAG